MCERVYCEYMNVDICIWVCEYKLLNAYDFMCMHERVYDIQVCDLECE